MAAMVVDILSRRMVRPSPRDGEERRRFDLTPWDLRLLSIDYIQKGILFSKQGDHDTMITIISRLYSSFSRAIDHFFPLAGRLVTVNHDTAPPSLSIFLDCNDDGAEFIHASARDITVSGILTPLHSIPPIVNALFPLNGVIGIDGHSSPLLAVQVTELADGIFIACSLNHAVADGTAFWHFFNSWSEISRTGIPTIPHPPVFDRWFLDSCPPPIRLPYSHHREFIIRRHKDVHTKECFFHFSARSIAKLKAKANAEAGTDRISSLQSLLAHVWRSVTRARGLEPQQQTSYKVVVGYRSRLNPPLPQTYIGNMVMGAWAAATAEEVVERGLGWAAWRLNQAVASKGDAEARSMLESWSRSPSMCVELFRPCGLSTGSSPRFNIYGNDVGWGRPVAVRSGCGNKHDGKVTVYPGLEEGSMALEVCISAGALSVLLEDKEFMETVAPTAECDSPVGLRATDAFWSATEELAFS